MINYGNLEILRYRICKYGIYHVYLNDENDNLIRLFISPMEFTKWYDKKGKTKLEQEPYKNVLNMLKKYQKEIGKKIWYDDIYDLY
jgi:hypothetical protein